MLFTMACGLSVDINGTPQPQAVLPAPTKTEVCEYPYAMDNLFGRYLSQTDILDQHAQMRDFDAVREDLAILQDIEKQIRDVDVSPCMEKAKEYLVLGVQYINTAFYEALSNNQNYTVTLQKGFDYIQKAVDEVERYFPDSNAGNNG